MRCTGTGERCSVRQPVATPAPSFYVADGLSLTRAGARAQACTLPRILLTLEMRSQTRFRKSNVRSDVRGEWVVDVFFADAWPNVRISRAPCGYAAGASASHVWGCKRVWYWLTNASRSAALELCTTRFVCVTLVCMSADVIKDARAWPVQHRTLAMLLQRRLLAISGEPKAIQLHFMTP